MQKLRVIGLFGCLIINNYATEQNPFIHPALLPPDHFSQPFCFFSSSEVAGDGFLGDRKDDLPVPLAESPDWLDLASLFVAQQGDFSQKDSSQRVVPADFKDTVSETQSPPEQSRFAGFFQQLEHQRDQQGKKAFDEQANTLAYQTSATALQPTESRFADFFRQNNQPEPAKTIQTAAALLHGLNPQAQEFTPNVNRRGDKRPLGDQQREQIGLCSEQRTAEPLDRRRRVNIEPLNLQPPSISQLHGTTSIVYRPLLPAPVVYPGLLPAPVVYPGFLPVPIVDQQSLSRNAQMEMENMKNLYYYEKTFFNRGEIHCCRSACTQGGQVYSGHALICHYEGLASYLQREGLRY